MFDSFKHKYGDELGLRKPGLDDEEAEEIDKKLVR
jgi:hypothetical protein